MVSPTESPLAGPADAGDAFRAAIPTVYGYLVHRCGSVAVAEDLTQETFAAAVAALRSGTTDATETRWLVGVARHKLVDHYRRHGRERDRLRALVPSRRSPELEAWSQEPLRDRIRDALLRLPDGQRLALVLRYMDDLSVPETARMIGGRCTPPSHCWRVAANASVSSCTRKGTPMDEARARTLLRALDGPVEPRPELTERLSADIDAGLGGATAVTAETAGAPTDRRWRWVALASAAALVLGAVLVANRPPGPDRRVRTGGPASPAPAAPPADTTASTDADSAPPAGTAPALAPAAPGGRVVPTITTTVARPPTGEPKTEAAPPPTAPSPAADTTTQAATAGVRLASIAPTTGTSRYGTLSVRDLEGSAPPAAVADGVAWPGWSPDGSSLVVETETDIRILRTDGSVVRTFGGGYFPSFSPDGTQLVFSRPCADIAVCNTEVVVVGVDGTNLRSLGRGAYPSWMPGGKGVVFTDVATVCDGGTVDPCHGPIAMVNADGTGRRALKVRGSFPRLSPSGRLAYAFGDPGNSDIHVSGLDGSDARVVSASPGDDIAPAWLPDGGALVYQSSSGLVLVDADGSDRRDLGPGRSPAVVGIR